MDSVNNRSFRLTMYNKETNVSTLDPVYTPLGDELFNIYQEQTAGPLDPEGAKAVISCFDTLKDTGELDVEDLLNAAEDKEMRVTSPMASLVSLMNPTGEVFNAVFGGITAAIAAWLTKPLLLAEKDQETRRAQIVNALKTRNGRGLGLTALARIVQANRDIRNEKKRRGKPPSDPRSIIYRNFHSAIYGNAEIATEALIEMGTHLIDSHPSKNHRDLYDAVWHGKLALALSEPVYVQRAMEQLNGTPQGPERNIQFMYLSRAFMEVPALQRAFMEAMRKQPRA